MSTTPERPGTIHAITDGMNAGFALLAAMQLDLFTPLADAPLDAQALAQRLEVDPDRLERLLYALAAVDLLRLTDGRFEPTPEAARYLVRGTPDSMLGRRALYAQTWRAGLETAASVRSGEPRAQHDYHDVGESEDASFVAALHWSSKRAGETLAERFDFSGDHTLVDIAGGTGGLAIALTEANLALHATVLELPATAPTTQRHIDAAGAAERVRVLATDVLDDEPSPESIGAFDVATMRNFTQVLAPERAHEALQRAGDLLRPGGTLYLLARVLDDTRTAPRETALIDVTFLNLYPHGRAYTESEYRHWLDEAGFTLLERVRPTRGSGILVARKRAAASKS